MPPCALRKTPIHTFSWRQCRPVLAAWIHSSASTCAPKCRLSQLLYKHNPRSMRCLVPLMSTVVYGFSWWQVSARARPRRDSRVHRTVRASSTVLSMTRTSA